jgi:hypothetical protein
MTSGHQVISASNWARAADGCSIYKYLSGEHLLWRCLQHKNKVGARAQFLFLLCCTRFCFEAHIDDSGFVAHFPIECCELNVLEKGVIGGLNSFGSLVLLSGWWNVPRHVMLALAWHDVTQRGLNQPCQHDLSCLVVSYTCFSQCPFLYWNDDPQLFESFWRCSGGSTSPILAPKPWERREAMRPRHDKRWTYPRVNKHRCGKTTICRSCFPMLVCPKVMLSPFVFLPEGFLLKWYTPRLSKDVWVGPRWGIQGS